MATDPPAAAPDTTIETNGQSAPVRSNSFSQQSHTSENSQTAADFLRHQELLEADAREALPYSIDSCTKILGPLRQNIFACLTCNPSESEPAGICYACSVQCHGEHELVEIFQKRNFTCDCGTKRIPSTSPCVLRTNEQTNTRGNVHSEEPDVNNKYNQNFRNRFCGCECDYDPFQQKGTMFQCLGLGTQETGGCGEDWYHPGCLVGMGPEWFEKMKDAKPKANGQANENGLATISENNEDKPEAERNANDEAIEDDEDEPPMPPGFPDEDEFDGFLCYKCVESNPWIKQYAGTSGFLPAVYVEQPETSATEVKAESTDTPAIEVKTEAPATEAPKPEDTTQASKKRKAEDDDAEEAAEVKRVKGDAETATNGIAANGSTTVTTTDSAPPPPPVSPAKLPTPTLASNGPPTCKLPNLGPVPTGRFSLFFKDEFRDRFCRCTACYQHLNSHAQLLEEEEVYEPPLSEEGASQHGGSTHGSGSLLERGESALRNVDRVRAIEGVMAYNHLKEQLKPFFQQFAESGKAVGAEDIKAYFAKLRGDEQGIKEAGEAAAAKGGDGHGEGDAAGGRDGDRKEQSGY